MMFLLAFLRAAFGQKGALVAAAVALTTSTAMAQTTTSAPPAQPAPATAVPATATPAPPPEAPAAASEAPGMPATVIDDKQIESLLGKPVQSPTGEDMGRIVDILVDKTGQIRAAVVDFGGFFGVGTRKIAVDWRSLHFISNNKNDVIAIDLPRNQLRVSPIYKEGEPVVILGRAAGGEAKPAEAKPPAAAPAIPAASPAPAATPAPQPQTAVDPAPAPAAK